MGRYVARRLLLTIPVLFGASFLIFALVFALPGDPIRALSGDRPLSAAVEAQYRERFNLNDPLVVQYGKYVANLAQGDFGTDFRGRAVTDIVLDRLPVTARLTAVAITIEALIGVTAGILSGLKRGSFLDNVVTISTILVISIPVFVLGYLGQFTFGIQLGIFPVAGIQQGWVSYLLPGLVLASISLAYVARLLRTSIAENLRSDYVRTAKAKGLSRTRVVGKHTLRNSLIPVVTYLGADVGNLMAGAIITETVFNLPGLGRAVYEAVLGQEGAVVVGIVTLFIVVFILANLVVDVLYAALDPRIRYE